MNFIKGCNICNETGWIEETWVLVPDRKVCWMCDGSGSKPKKFLKRLVKYLLHYSLLIILIGAILIALGYRLFFN